MGKGRTIKYAARLFLAVIIGVALLGSLPMAVQAQEPIDLELGGEGATSWSIDNIMPCDNGTKTVTLQNIGSEDGFVTIWVNTIESDEGLNPEPETNKEVEDGGELDDHLLLGLSSSNGLSTNLSLPTTINNFPQSASDSNYIRINPLNSGDTVTLVWEWELPCETGNDAQGDTLSFTINYLLEEFPPPTPSPTGGGGGGGGVSECYLEIDMLGEITKVRVRCCSNSVIEDCMAFDPDELHFLELEQGTLVICGESTGCRSYPRVVVMSLAEEAPPAPDGMAIVGPVYDFTGYKDRSRYIVCEATFFDPPISMLLSYDPETLPEGAFSPVIAFYDAEQGLWVELPADTGRVAEVGKVTGLANRFASPFAVLVSVPPPPTPPPPPPAPAHFVVSSLNIAPSVREIWQPVTFVTLTGENVTITVNVANDGGQEGSYLVELKINGETIDKKEITLGAGQSEQVSFTLSGMEPGQYEVVISGLSGEFTVLQTINWWLIGGIIAALILLGWLGWYLRKRLS